MVVVVVVAAVVCVCVCEIAVCKNAFLMHGYLHICTTVWHRYESSKREKEKKYCVCVSVH